MNASLSGSRRPHPLPAPTPVQRRRSMLVAAFGTIVEWFDFSIFFYVSVSLTQAFFPEQENSLLLVLGTGAIGFVFRPLGAMVFGHLGDRIGRKQALVISAGLMSIAMFGIAVMPGYEAIGLWGGVGVIALRCLAGFSVGAEYTGIMVFLMESARESRRGFAASWAAANSEVGALLAVGLSSWLAFGLGSEAMSEWAWRIMFVVGGLLAAVMIPLRKLLVETETFQNTQKAESAQSRSPLLTVLRDHPKAVVLAFLISTVGSATYFLNITYVPTYLESVTSLGSGTALGLGTVAALAAIVVTPFIGLAADRFGRRPVFTVVAAVVVLGTVPAYLALVGTSTALAGMAVAALAVPAAAWSAVAAAAVPEQFTAVGRFSGMAVGYNVAAALFGGFSPMVVTWLMKVTGSDLAPAVYAAVVVLLAAVPAIFLMRDMARVPVRELDADPVLEEVREPTSV